MADDAQLVFCPYSYIINPVIRGAMEVDIKGAIVILDEAQYFSPLIWLILTFYNLLFDKFYSVLPRLLIRLLIDKWWNSD